MSLLMPERDLEPAEAGVSRRRILKGVAWGTPAVLIATAAPAAAASDEPPGVGEPRVLPPTPLPTGTGMEVNSLTAQYQASRWNSTSGSQIKAVNCGLYMQNKGNTAPATGSVILTLIVPVGSLTNPRWGIGNGDGIPSDESWTLASGPSVAAGKATITLVYTGGALGPWGGVSVSNLWVETSGSVTGQVATAVVNATYQGNSTSTHSISKTV